MIRKSMSLLLATSLLSGCYAFRGPEPVMLRGSVVHHDRAGQRAGFLYERFRIATREAAGCGRELAPQYPLPAADAPPPNTTCEWQPQDETRMDQAERKRLMAAFMNAGYELIYAECADYFDAMGRRQRGTRAASATLGPISTLIAGIIGIARPDDSGTRDAVQAVLALGTTGITAALSIYDQHFLFGSDNIDAVRARVQDALRAHAVATLALEIDTFGRAANHVVDNQAICGPSSILTIVRQSISAARLEANVSQSRQGPAQIVQIGQAPPAQGQPQPTPIVSDRVEVRVRPN